MFHLAAEGKGALVSDNFALLRGFKLGDFVELPSPKGMVRLPILGVVTDYSDQQGSVLIDRTVFTKYWDDTTVDLFRIYLQRGAPEADVKRRILERFSNQRRLFVLTNRDLRRYILRLTDQWFGITYVQIAVAVIVAILGIVNTLTVSITGRRVAQPNPSHHLDGGTGNRSYRRTSRVCARSGAALLQLGTLAPGFGWAAAGLRIPLHNGSVPAAHHAGGRLSFLLSAG
jgi:hypothetical protein